MQDNLSKIVIFSLVALDIFIWSEILFIKPAEEQISFLDVGQGDAILQVLPGGVKILTDAGPSQQVVRGVEKVIGKGDRYIDLAVISHPQLDHFNGFNYLLRNYKFGAFLWNGREAENAEWKVLMSAIEDKKIPLIVIGAGDRINYASSTVEIISPNQLYLQSAELNDTSIVELIKVRDVRALLTGDIGFSVENHLANLPAQAGLSAQAGNFDIRANILKVPHHGSKNSSGKNFLATVAPRVAVIQVGAGNGYGHPTKEALSNILATGARISRTDTNGTITIKIAENKLQIFPER